MHSNASVKIRILIVDDMAQVRQGLRTILHLWEDIEVVGEASNGLEAIAATEELRPKVILMDLAMPVLDGLETTRRIKEQHPEIGIVILTIHGSAEVRAQAASAGADSFIEKEAPTESLIEAIRDVSFRTSRSAKQTSSFD